jgi:hypothetical protein
MTPFYMYCQHIPRDGGGPDTPYPPPRHPDTPGGNALRTCHSFCGKCLDFPYQLYRSQHNILNTGVNRYPEAGWSHGQS